MARFNEKFKATCCLENYENFKSIENINTLCPEGADWRWRCFKKVLIQGQDNEVPGNDAITVGEDIYAKVTGDLLKIWSPEIIEFEDDSICIFTYMERVEEVIMTDGLSFEHVTSFMQTFADSQKLLHVKMKADCKNIYDFNSMFSWCSNLENAELDFSNTGSVKEMRKTFLKCYKLTKITCESWDVSHVKSMKSMFEECQNLKNIPIQEWNTSSLENMSRMFKCCLALKKNPTEKWDVSKVRDVKYLFSECWNLKEIDLSSWDTSRLEDTSYMFYVCKEMEKVNLDNWDGFNIKNVSFMFKECKSLEDVSMKWKREAFIGNAEYAFSGCTSLKIIDISSFDFSRCRNTVRMFEECEELFWVENAWNLNPSLWNTKGMFMMCSSLMFPDISAWKQKDL